MEKNCKIILLLVILLGSSVGFAQAVPPPIPPPPPPGLALGLGEYFFLLVAMVLGVKQIKD